MQCRKFNALKKYCKLKIENWESKRKVTFVSYASTKDFFLSFYWFVGIVRMAAMQTMNNFQSKMKQIVWSVGFS